ncbi:MAG: hypothetical protein OXH13_05510 [Chloroflexi bacterium]|nr:hypothetical protein [Chloroflexota bacterium]MCY3696267.1 hypothetical protein [Chloroflexota bacterium]
MAVFVLACSGSELRVPKVVPAESTLIGPPVFGEALLWAWVQNEEHGTGVSTSARAIGARYGLAWLQVECVNGAHDVWIGMLPSTSEDSLTVRWKVDGRSVEEQKWEVDRAYAAYSGYIAHAGKPSDVFDVWRDANHLVIELPELGVGPAEFNLLPLFSTVVQENLDRCGETAFAPGAYDLTDRRPQQDVAGQLDNRTQYEVEVLSGNRTLTTIAQMASYDDGDGPPIELRIGCNPAGSVNVALVDALREALTPSPAGIQPHHVTVRVGDSAVQSEQWYMYVLADRVELRAPESAFMLVQAMARNHTLVISVPELEIWNAQFDLPPVFSTPVQENLNYCGYAAAG